MINRKLSNFLVEYQRKIDLITNGSIDEVCKFYKEFILTKNDSKPSIHLYEIFKKRFLQENIDINNL